MAHIAYYVTGHGFGHATRAQAIIEELLETSPDTTVELRSSAPRRAFSGLEDPRCRRVEVDLDPGVEQGDSFSHDIAATYEAWRELFDNANALVEAEAESLRASGANVVLSDAGPLPCAVAAACGIPAFVIANFTWDWILEGYLHREPRLAAIIDEIRRAYGLAEAYLRLPLSPEAPIFRREERVGFVARRRRVAPQELRRALGVGDEERLVLLSFGGFGVSQLDLSCIEGAASRGSRVVWEQPEARPPDLLSVASGQPTLPPGLRYTDLIAAADVVVSKPGFGIIAECVAQRRRLLWVPRGDFREAPLLEAFLAEREGARRMERAALTDGRWLREAQTLAESPTPASSDEVRGATEICSLLAPHLG